VKEEIPSRISSSPQQKRETVALPGA